MAKPRNGKGLYSPIRANLFGLVAEEKFRARVSPPNAAGCCLWVGSIRHSYGIFYINERHVLAHRIAWELANGLIPDGLNVLHRCDTPACVNPEHLFIGTNAENIADKVAKGRQAFQRGSTRGMARLTEAEAVEIFLASGTPKTIGERYGISKGHVTNIKGRKSWAHATVGLIANKERT